MAFYNEDSSYDKRFFGIYRGIVVDAADPLSKNRLRVKVPQVTGDAVTNWAWPCRRSIITGHDVPTGIHARGYDSNTSSVTVNTVGSAPTLVTFDTVTGTDQITMTGTPQSRITVTQKGTYYLAVNLQVQYGSPSSQQTFVSWFRKNGNNIGGSAKRVTTTGAGHYHNFVLMTTQDMEAGDYLEVACVGSNNQYTLDYTAGGGASTIDSAYRALFNMFSIAGTTAIQGAGVWVMYEGGDPNFPVWMGVF